MVFASLLSDYSSIVVSFLFSFFLYDLITHDLSLENFGLLIPLLALYTFSAALWGLIPSFAFTQVEEYRRISIVVTIAYLSSLILIIYSKNVSMLNQLSRGFFLTSWLLSIEFVFVLRIVVRKLLSSWGVWGIDGIIIGQKKYVHLIEANLTNSPNLGIKPISHIIIPDHIADEKKIQSYILRKINQVRLGLLNQRIECVIIDSHGLPRDLVVQTSNKISDITKIIYLIAPYRQVGSTSLTPIEIGEDIGYGVQQNLLFRRYKILKRVFDLMFSILALPFALMILILAGLAIKLDSAGPVFIRQERIGRFGRKFNIFKLRTMAVDWSPKFLKTLNKKQLLEWERAQKLVDDPRVTRVGKILRKFSIDELPQIFNILCGEMSWIGPRPITKNEIYRYGSNYSFYTKVLPGLTGLWQVSGRNLLKYDQRVKLDYYYGSNWSIWLDFYILQKTIYVILLARGAF